MKTFFNILLNSLIIFGIIVMKTFFNILLNSLIIFGIIVIFYYFKLDYYIRYLLDKI
jgi:hypothetical protein